MGNFVNILQKRNFEKFCKTKERFVLETNEFAYNETVEVTDNARQRDDSTCQIQ